MMSKVCEFLGKCRKKGKGSLEEISSFKVGVWEDSKNCNAALE